MTYEEQLITQVADALRRYQIQPGVLQPGNGTLWIDHAEEPAIVALEAVPEGMAKINGKWVQLALYGPVKVGDGQEDAYVPALSLVRAPEVTARIRNRAAELRAQRSGKAE